MVGPTEWLADTIAEGSCIGAMDGSYIQTLQEDICSTAFFFESSDRSCKLVGAFAELSIVANAYRGELLGLMALHLILLAVNEVNPGLKGEITLHSDCLGAISQIEDLPPGKIPSACKHADILKNILIACKRLTFDIVREHIEAHQDDGMEFHMLTCAAQLNCAVDAGAKRALLAAIKENVTRQQAFPLEPIICFAGEHKLTPDMKAYMHFWVQKQLVRKALSDLKIIWRLQLNKIDWKYVHTVLEGVP